MASTRRPAGLLRPSVLVRRASISKGLLGDDRFWRTIFLLMMGRRAMRKIMGSDPEVVALDRLEPGQFMTIEAIDPRAVARPAKGQKRRRPR